VNLSRRDILKGAAATLLTGASSMAITPALAGSKPNATTTPATGVDELTRAAFVAVIGTEFHVQVGALQTAAVRLESVTDLVAPRGSRPAAPGKEGFTLVFAGDARHAFPQGTYILHHPKLGSFALMLVAAGTSGSVSRYDAVINRLWP
jgi:hypothetical protein